MKLQHPISLGEAAAYLQCRMIGPADMPITGLNEIHKVEEGDLSFVDYHKYYDRALQSAATVIMINAEVDFPPHKGILISDDPFRDYNRLVQRYYDVNPVFGGKFLQGKDVKLGKNVVIMENVVIGDRVSLGDNCRIFPNVVIQNDTIIGNNVTIHANTTIGSDAFYYKKRPTGYDKLLSCGRVIIHDDVEIGSGCTIDKGVSGDTIIGAGTKFDNQVHIGHGAVIGRNCLFAAQVGVGGKTIIEDDVTLWGQVGVQKDILIEKGAVVLGQSGVSKSLKGNKVYFGSPAGDAKNRYRELTYLRRLPEFMDRYNRPESE